MAKLTATQKNTISRNKEILSKQVLETNKIDTLSNLEKEFLQDILTRHLKDQRGNYDLRINELNHDLYTVLGIKYRNIYLNAYSYEPVEGAANTYQ